MSDAVWYYSKGEAQHGPVATADLRRMVAGGELMPDDLIWKSGMAEWESAGRFNALFPKPGASKRSKSASVNFNCPQCGAAIRAAADAVGQLAKCEGCNEEVRVPASRAALADAAAVASHVRVKAADVVERYREISSAHFWDGVLGWFRRQVSQELLDVAADWMSTWGAYALAVAMLVGPAHLAIYALKSDSIRLLGLAAGTFGFLIVLQYIVRRLLGTLHLLVQGTPSRMASTAFLDSFALLTLLCAAATVSLGLYLFATQNAWIDMNGFLSLAIGSAGWAYAACLALHPKALSITPAPDTSMGEEAVGVLSFFLKLWLRCVPFTFGTGALVGTAILLLSFIEVFLGESWSRDSLEHAVAGGTQVLIAAVIPVVTYLLSIFLYMILDVVRSVLIIPGKLDSLTRALGARANGGNDAG